MVMVTPPVEPDREIPVPAVSDVTPVLAITPVDEVYEIPVPPERLVLEILLLKVFQSVLER